MLKKVNSLGKKYWWLIAIGAFIIGVGSLVGAKSRAEEIVKNPATAVTK